MKWTVFAIAAATLVSGCNQAPAITCASDDSKSVISSIVTDAIAKSAWAQLEDTASETGTTEAKVRATVNQIKVQIEDIRTTKEDPNSTKRFCEGTMKVVVPLSVLTDAESARRAMDVSELKVLLEQVGLERSADTLSRQVNFSVQPTDDGKKIYGEVEAFDTQLEALGELVASHLVRPQVDAMLKAEAMEAQALQQQIEAASAAQNQADLELASAENKLATQTINELWRNLPEEIQTDLLPVQRAWIKKKTADCNIKAAEASTDPVLKEAARLRCDTEVTRVRSSQLREILEG